MLFMRVFIIILVLIFSLQSWTKADDISDFEIEGININESALNHFDVNDLEKGKKEKYTYFYPENKFIKITISTGESGETALNIVSKIYDDLSITIKPNDKNYIIYSLSGRIYCKDNINICINLQNEVIRDLAHIIKNAEKSTYKDPHPSDQSNKSFVYGNDFYFKDNGSISISVYDWSDKMNKERDWQDSLQVGVNSGMFDKFLWSLN